MAALQWHIRFDLPEAEVPIRPGRFAQIAVGVPNTARSEITLFMPCSGSLHFVSICDQIHNCNILQRMHRKATRIPIQKQCIAMCSNDSNVFQCILMLISVWPIHINALAYKADEGLCGKSMKILDSGPMQMESAGDWNTLTWSKGATIEGFAQMFHDAIICSCHS